MANKSQSLVHDVAYMTSQHLMELFAHLLREEEIPDAWHEVYKRVRAGIECFQMKAERLEQRLKPTAKSARSCGVAIITA